MSRIVCGIPYEKAKALLAWKMFAVRVSVGRRSTFGMWMDFLHMPWRPPLPDIDQSFPKCSGVAK